MPGVNPRRYITVAHVQRDWIDTSDIRYFEVSDAELERWRLYDGDVLVIEGNGSPDQIGRAALFRGEIEDCVHQNHVIRVRPERTRLLPEFLNAYFNSSAGRQEMLERSRTTSGLFNLSVSRIKQIDVPLPSLEEQRGTITYLDNLQAKVDSLARLQAETAAELDALLPSVLNRAFKGKL
jgi:type I restriction enzyme S subunit